MLMVKKLAKEEEQMLFFFEAMMLIGLVMLLGGLFIRVREVAWTGGWLVTAALMFFKWDVLGVFLLVLPGPFSYWYLQKYIFRLNRAICTEF